MESRWHTGRDGSCVSHVRRTNREHGTRLNWLKREQYVCVLLAARPTTYYIVHVQNIHGGVGSSSLFLFGCSSWKTAKTLSPDRGRFSEHRQNIVPSSELGKPPYWQNHCGQKLQWRDCKICNISFIFRSFRTNTNTAEHQISHRTLDYWNIRNYEGERRRRKKAHSKRFLYSEMRSKRR